MVFQVIALTVLAAFYGCYFGKMLSQRRQGIQTDQIGKGKHGFVLGIEMTMKVVTIIVPVAEVISIVCNASGLPTAARWAGACLAAAGVAAFILSVVTMRDSWRAGVSETDKTELVTHGIYRYSRNPAFLGFDLVYLGVLLMFFNWPLYLLSALAALLLHLQIVNVEEDHLIEAFGEEYTTYMRQVRRYLGRR